MSSREYGWAMDQDVEPVSKLALLLLADNAHDFYVAFTMGWLVRRMHCSQEMAEAALGRLDREKLIFVQQEGEVWRAYLKSLAFGRVPTDTNWSAEVLT